MHTPESRQNAELRDVSGVRCNQACQAHAADTAGRRVNGKHGGFRRESAAAWKPDDVCQKLTSAWNGAVLVVDLAVDVTTVCGGNHMGHVFQVSIRPRYEVHAERWLPRSQLQHSFPTNLHEMTVVPQQIPQQRHWTRTRLGLQQH